MSLRVWLPLNGDLRNQGLNNYQITTLGTITFPSSGKIGKCFQAGNGTQIINGLRINSNLIDILAQDYSIAVWIKPLGNHVHYNGTIISSGDWNHTRWAFGVSQDNTKVDVLCNGHNTYINCKVPVNTWTHLICIRTSDGKVSLYKNGEYVNFLIRSDHPQSDANITTIGRETYANGYFSFNGCINDVRIYDHALSEQEIKKLAQGLILHYPLNDSFVEETTNLITTEDCLSSTCFNGATKKYGYGTNTDMYKVTGVFQGKKATKLYMGTSGLQAKPYPYFNNLFVSNGTNSPAYKTLSFDYYGTIGTYITPYKLGNGNGTCTWTNDKTEVKTGSYTNSGNIPVVPNKWNHITMVLHGITEADAQWGYIILGDQHTSNTSNYWLFANAQIEVKDHETGYAGVGKSRIKNTVYDISGNLYNGIENNIIYSTNSPLYKGSFVLNGSNSYIKNDNNNWISNYPEQLTVSIWAYSNNWSGVTNGGRIWSCTETGGFNIQGGSSGYWRFPVYCATNSEHTSHAYYYNNSALKISDLSEGWHMITWVYTTTEHKVYLDSQLMNTYEIQTYGIKFNTSARLFLGCEASGPNPSAPYFNGKLSDFRIYATALSADDIKELYENREKRG